MYAVPATLPASPPPPLPPRTDSQPSDRCSSSEMRRRQRAERTRGRAKRGVEWPRLQMLASRGAHCPLRPCIRRNKQSGTSARRQAHVGRWTCGCSRWADGEPLSDQITASHFNRSRDFSPLVKLIENTSPPHPHPHHQPSPTSASVSVYSKPVEALR